jgi:hypothetical protein
LLDPAALTGAVAARQALRDHALKPEFAHRSCFLDAFDYAEQLAKTSYFVPSLPYVTPGTPTSSACAIRDVDHRRSGFRRSRHHSGVGIGVVVRLHGLTEDTLGIAHAPARSSPAI